MSTLVHRPFRAHRGLRRARGMLLGVGLAIVLAACGDSEPTPAAYFEALETETGDFADALAELRRTYGEELAGELDTLHDRTDFSDPSSVVSYFDSAKEAAIVRTADLYSRESNELRVFMDSLRLLEPPEELTQAHDDFVAAAEALAAAAPVTIEAVRNLESVEDLPTSLQETPYTVALQRFGIACQNLGTAAAGQGIEVDLACPGAPDNGTDSG